MNLIAAVDRNWAIGYQGSLLVRIPSDQRLFHEMTEGNVVVMGRKTLESLPQKQPLKKRVNIVLSRNKNYSAKGAYIVHSIEELMEKLKEYDDSRVYVAGGGSVYEQLLPYCNAAYITKIDYAYQADTYLPDLDKQPEWRLTAYCEEQTYFDLEYYLLKYERKNITDRKST